MRKEKKIILLWILYLHQLKHLACFLLIITSFSMQHDFTTIKIENEAVRLPKCATT
jgi:hypothetical protein